MNSKTFPKNFLWGAATAAHQVEGGMKNDWSEWEKKKAKTLAREASSKFGSLPNWGEIKTEATDPQNYISGRAVDHYGRYAEDIAIMKKLGLTAYRFSIEWSRVEPRQGEFDQKEIEHYRDVIRELRENNIEPFVTLWHRTNPLWIRDIRDWENKRTPGYFAKFTERMAEEYKTDVRYWMTLNEPLMSVAGGYIGGVYPPEVKNIFRANRVFKNMVRAHRLAFDAIHKVQPEAVVGITHAVVYAEPYQRKFLNRLAVAIIEKAANWRVLNAVKDKTDFIGVQYYTRGLVNIKLGGNVAGIAEEIKEATQLNDMGWEIHPHGIHDFLVEVAKYNKPIYITENGIPDQKDRFRTAYIKTHLDWVQKAMDDGVDVRGYFYWSLLDNLEWDKGFWPKFGLVAVDRKTMKRTIRPSAWEYAKIIKNNGLEN